MRRGKQSPAGSGDDMSLVMRERAGGAGESDRRTDLASVTDRELAVLSLMANGLIATAIARRLGISPRTVSKHIENIYRKLGAHDRTTAVLRSQAMGVLPPVSLG